MGRRDTMWDEYRLTESGLYLSDNTIANASTSQHGLLPKLSGNVTDVLRGNGTFGGVSGVSGSAPQEYDVRVKDASPASETDEFSSSTITGWTDINWSGAGFTEDANTTQPGALWVQDTSQSTRRFRLKAMPAGDGRIYTLVTGAQPGTNFVLYGLVITDGTTPGAGNQMWLVCGWHSSVSSANFVTLYQKEQNFNGTSPVGPTGITFPGVTSALLRITRSGSTYKFGVSPVITGGRVWYDVTVTPGFTASHMGLFCFNSCGTTVQFVWEFFRYYSSATANTGGVP